MFLIAIFVGANTVLCRYLNAAYAKHNGLSMATLMNYLTGLTTALIVLFIMGEPAAIQSIGTLSLRKIMMFLGGAFGVALVQLLIYITPRIPAFLGAVLVFISQLGTGLALDYAFTGVIGMGKLLGGLLVMLGLAHYTWVNRAPAAQPKSIPK
jgi:bacterial/archaeal transporter family-2 protein